MDEKEQTEKKTDDSKTPTKDPESQPKENVAPPPPLQKLASVESSNGSGSSNKESPKTDSGLMTKPTSPDPSVSTSENNSNKESVIISSFPTISSIKTSTSGESSNKASPTAAGKTDVTPPSTGQNDPHVLHAVQENPPPPTPPPSPPNVPGEVIEMQEVTKPPASSPAGTPPDDDEGVTPADGSAPQPDEYANDDEWNLGCMSILCLILLAFIFAMLSPFIGYLISIEGGNSTVTAQSNATCLNGTFINGTCLNETLVNATYSNETFDGDSFAGNESITTELYDVFSSDST